MPPKNRLRITAAIGGVSILLIFIILLFKQNLAWSLGMFVARFKNFGPDVTRRIAQGYADDFRETLPPTGYALLIFGFLVLFLWLARWNGIGEIHPQRKSVLEKEPDEERSDHAG